MDDSEGNVVELEDYRPHFTLTVSNGDVHVLSVALIWEIIRGRVALTEVEDWESMMLAILEDWMDRVVEDGA